MLRVILAALILTGCDNPRPVPLRDEVFVHVKLVDTIAPNTLGQAQCNEGVCLILIERDSYPLCLGHELRHAFEGAWHGNEPSTEDCF